MNKWIVIVAVLIVVLGGGYFLFKNSAAPAPSEPAQTTNAVTPTSAETSPSQTNAITVEGNEFAFTPSTITVKKGEAVKVTFKNTGKFPHNFTIAELNVQSKTIQSGEEDTFEFTPTQTGQFTYVCSVPGHADRGMKGTLTVE